MTVVRIKQTDSTRAGYQARSRKDATGYTASEFFADDDSGGPEGARLAAERWCQLYHGGHPQESIPQIHAFPGKRNTSGMVGVCRALVRGKPVWIAQVRGHGMGPDKKSYTVGYWGEEEARRRAVRFRTVWALYSGANMEKEFWAMARLADNRFDLPPNPRLPPGLAMDSLPNMEALILPRRRPTPPDYDTRVEAVQNYVAGRWKGGLETLAAAIGVSRSSIYKYVRQFRESGRQGLALQRNPRPRAELGQVQASVSDAPKFP